MEGGGAVVEAAVVVVVVVVVEHSDGEMAIGRGPRRSAAS